MSERTPTLLFVCVQNSCRSQMAEEFARALGRGRVSTFTAGSFPSGQVNPRAIQFMAERDIDLTPQPSKGLDALPPIQWSYVVTMGCGDVCPHLPAKHRLDWDLPDPKHMDDAWFRALRDRIEGLVKALLAEAVPSEAVPGAPG